MEALDYIKLLKMDQPNYNFDRNDFIEKFGKEFTLCLQSKEYLDPELGVLTYPKFKEIVGTFEKKFQDISTQKLGKPLSKGLWNAFYAIWVIPARAKLYPKLDAKIKHAQAMAIANNPSHPKYNQFKDYPKNPIITESRDKI